MAALLLTLFVWRCLKRPDPLLDVRLFRSKPFTAGTVAAFTASLAMAGIMLLVAQWLQGVAGFTPILAGLALLPMAVGSLATAPFAPTLAIRFGARAILSGGLAVAGIGLVGLFALRGLDTYWQLIAPLVLVGAGTGALAIASAIIMGSTPQEKAGNAAAIEESMYDLGNVFGIALLGSIAAVLYRAYLDIQNFTGDGITGQLAVEANESVVGALIVAESAGLPELAAAATAAFVTALGRAALVGGVIMLLAAIAVYLLVPRGFDITAHNHPDDPPADPPAQAQTARGLTH
ncbi:MFS transporter [Saccharomonospora sp. NPDC046836]|uniref:MFS transporter n=1 Tax=Saccharomonospora sp. NPDC046836 TaxID=3156921 RepID=UPI0033DEA66D